MHIAANHSGSTIIVGRFARPHDDVKCEAASFTEGKTWGNDGHLRIRVCIRRRIVHIYVRSYRRFSQATVNDHPGGRTRRDRTQETRWHTWYVCAYAYMQHTYSLLCCGKKERRVTRGKDRSLGNGDWFFRRDFYLDIVCGNFLVVFTPIRQLV